MKIPSVISFVLLIRPSLTPVAIWEILTEADRKALLTARAWIILGVVGFSLLMITPLLGSGPLHGVVLSVSVMSFIGSGVCLLLTKDVAAVSVHRYLNDLESPFCFECGLQPVISLNGQHMHCDCGRELATNTLPFLHFPYGIEILFRYRSGATAVGAWNYLMRQNRTSTVLLNAGTLLFWSGATTLILGMSPLMYPWQPQVKIFFFVNTMLIFPGLICLSVGLQKGLFGFRSWMRECEFELCLKCGYALKGADGICPECAWAFDRRALTRAWGRLIGDAALNSGGWLMKDENDC